MNEIDYYRDVENIIPKEHIDHLMVSDFTGVPKRYPVDLVAMVISNLLLQLEIPIRVSAGYTKEGDVCVKASDDRRYTLQPCETPEMLKVRQKKDGTIK